MSGCARGCVEDRPYTPYAVEGDETLFAKRAEAANEGDGATAADGEARADEVGRRGVARVPPEAMASRWVLDELELVAPENHGFVVGLAADLDGDGDRDAVAWVAPVEAQGTGKLLLYAGDAENRVGAPRPLAELPKLFPEGCTAEVALDQVGSGAVVVRADARCPQAPEPGASTRWMAVVSPAEEPALRQVVTVREPPRGERLHVTLDAGDRDGDGRDDLAVKVTLEGSPEQFEPGASATAELRWFDRPAGLSRDTDEPEASLRPQATRLMVRAERKNEAAAVMANARQLMRLYAALCEETGGALVDFATGPLRCGTSRALEDAVVAQVRAAVTLGDPLRALAAIERFSQWPTAHTKARRREADRILRKLVTIAEPDSSRVLQAEPLRLPGPSLSPLAFDEAGVLLVLTPNGVTRATVHGEEWPSEEDEPWPLAVMNASNRYRWASSFNPCDGLAYRLGFTGIEGDAHEITLPLLAPAHGAQRCAGHVPSHPLGVRSGSVEAVIAGEPWLLTMGEGTFAVKPLASSVLGGFPAGRGSAKSPDGRYWAVGTHRGVLVRDATKWTLWQLEGESDAPLEACTVSNGRRSVACIRDGRVVVASSSSGAEP